MSARGYAVGIDLGTSTSEICIFRQNRPEPVPDPSSISRSPIMPSMVALDSRENLVVGEAARPHMQRKNRGVREVKRLMGSGEMVSLGEKKYRPEEISALILRQLKSNTEDLMGISVNEVVISVPANFPDQARQATRDAGLLAGMNVIRIVNEPTAAAMAFGINHLNLEEQLLVFDYGGGTLDITILEMIGGILDVKCSYGDAQLGGKDFDQVMINLLAEKFLKEHPNATISAREMDSLKDAAESAKIILSNGTSHMVHISNFAVAKGEPVDLDVEITRNEFEHAAAALIDRARVCLVQALRAKSIRPEGIDRILLVGGSTYIPAVRRLVAEIMKKDPRSDINPDLAVSMGASIQAAILEGLIEPETGLIITDVSSFGLGVDVVKDVGEQMFVMYDELIKPNTTIPYSIQKNYHLLHPEQKSLSMKLFQDPTGKARFPDDAIFTGRAVQIKDIPPSTTQIPHDVVVDFAYNADGIIHLKATIPATQQSLAVSYAPSSMRLSVGDEIEAALRNVEELWKKNPHAKEHMSVIQKAEKMLPSLEPAKRIPLIAILNALKSALVDNNEPEIKNAGDKLVDMLFDIEQGSDSNASQE